MFSPELKRLAGVAAIAGGTLGVLLAPVMVVVKYMTGWAVVPQPAWIGVARDTLGPLLTFSSPVGLWVAYGRIYTIALVLMFVGLVAFAERLKDERGRVKAKGYWALLLGFALVIPGDAVHTATWHENGLTTPTPGTYPRANRAYAAHMMGMNLVMAGSLTLGVAGLRRKVMPRWMAWLFVLVFPAAVAASVTLLPTTPSGALWLFCVAMVAIGYTMAAPRERRMPHC
jgi:hypothetical protein